LPGDDVQHFVPGADVNAALGAEIVRRMHDQVVGAGNDARNQVGQPAGAVRDGLALLQHHHFHLRVDPAGAAGRAHSGGISADDHQTLCWHRALLFLV